MAFPSSPVDGQLYTTSLGTQYRYYLTDTAWKIVGSPGTGDITGTAGYLAKFVDGTTIGNSPFMVSGTVPTLLSTKQGLVDGSNIFLGGGGENVNGATASESSWNTSLGIKALEAVTLGSSNVAVGNDAGMVIQDANSNTLIGHKAGKAIISASGNTAVGANAMEYNVSGANNTAVGPAALNLNTAGSFNTVVGCNAGSNEELVEPNYCIYIGENSASGEINPVKEIVIGSSTAGLGSYSTQIGGTDNTKACIYGDTGFDNPSPQGRMHPMATGLEVNKCAAYTLGNTDASVGSFVRLDTPTYYRSDTGIMNDGCVLKIIGIADSDPSVRLEYTGYGYVWSQAFDSVEIRRTQFDFDDQIGVTLYNSAGDVFNYDISGPSPDGLAVFTRDASVASHSTELYIQNYHGMADGTASMGYNVWYWLTRIILD